MEQEQYQKNYDDFMKNYILGAVSGEQVGEMIARLAGFFPTYSINTVKAERAFSLISKENVLQNDEQTGKPISSAKAETLSLATEEAYKFKLEKAHMENLEVLIGALKFLQKGILTEYSQSNL